MECNKEEASRAKTIAERKMQDTDFAGARKFALKAQQLYPEIENICQMICVCDVHCSSEKKIFGNEFDWYAILQIEQTADDVLIKKQYRKFALLLHPDKNKFPGAESAFKLIGEAQRVLLDREKRSMYDIKRRTTYKPVIPNQASQQTSKGFNGMQRSSFQSYMGNPSSYSKGSNGPFQEPKRQARSGAANGRETFWTACPFCSIRYQYYKEVLNRALRCQSCMKPFIAYDMHGQATQTGSSTTQPVFPQQDASHFSETRFEAMDQKPTSTPLSKAKENAELGKSQKSRQSTKGVDNMHGDQVSKPSSKANGKRGKKQMVESSESFDSDSSLNSEDTEIQLDENTLRWQQFGNDGEQYTRRSSRNKRHVSYKENAIDDDEVMSSSKRAKVSGSSSPMTEKISDASGEAQPSKVFGPATSSVNEGRKGVSKNFDDDATVVEPIHRSSKAENVFVVDSSPEIIPDPKFHEYPDPEFCDFDKGREENCFKVGQVWAAYDTVDAMPRFYARIKKVFSPRFKLQIVWLEPDPDDEVGVEWANSELPFSCGKFKFGISEYTEDRLMFCHEVSLYKVIGRGLIKIYPRKGETWALFKNWDAKWYNIPQNLRKFEYEFVEILTEYDENIGVSIAPLSKIKGFACLFCRISGNEVQITPAEVLRFAHRVPSSRMTGDERKDVPKGSFELDPASVTMGLEEISLANLDGQNFVNSDSVEANPSTETSQKSASVYCDNEVEHLKHSDIDITEEDLPDSEFFNFDALKSVEKFQVNQVWALYSDIDALPKYYGLIKRIDPSPGFKLHVAWLEACNIASDTILWKDKNMPISCGQFKVKSGRMQQYTSSSSFSHELQAQQTGRKNVFAIYPRKGQVWALYKNWHPDIMRSRLNDCQHDIVEVLEENPSHFKVSVLERVDGFNLVFKPQKNGDWLIPCAERLRFSHQIPSFRLTDEKGGSLRGFWELDAAALPAHILYKN